ncbi:hypothetical protein AB6O49_34375 [Streptomyces sp. SBR177]
MLELIVDTSHQPAEIAPGTMREVKQDLLQVIAAYSTSSPGCQFSRKHPGFAETATCLRGRHRSEPTHRPARRAGHTRAGFQGPVVQPLAFAEVEEMVT